MTHHPTTHHIYITGVDGIGKTTQMNLLQQTLNQTHTTKRIWLRFPILLSLPLLTYARLRGYTKYQTIQGTRVGAWNFENSKLLTTLFPLTQYLDTLIYSIPKLLPPKLRHQQILFERYSLDILIDTAVAINDLQLHKKPIGQKLLNLIPKNTHIIILDAPENTIKQRRNDVKHDPALSKRLKLYRTIAQDMNLNIVKSDTNIQETFSNIKALIT